MTSETSEDKILTFLDHLKCSMVDAEVVFQNGGCFRLFAMIKVFYPQAIAWYDGIEDHVYTEVDGRFYDIRGRHRRLPIHSYRLEKERRIFRQAYRWKYEFKQPNLKDKNEQTDHAD